MAVKERYCYPVDIQGIDPRYICLAEPYSIGVQVNHRGRISTGDCVLIMGSGPIGLCVMQAAKQRGARVVMTDLVHRRLARALAMGADAALNAADADYPARVMALTKEGLGFQVVVDTACTASSFEQAIEMAAPAGRVVTLGLISAPSQIAQVDITKKELDVVGSRLSRNRFPEVIQGFQSGAFTPEALCTDVVPYYEAERAIRRIKEHPDAVCKIILQFDGTER